MSNLKHVGGGRHKDAVWACFESCSVDNVNKQRCIACGTLVSSKAPRLKQHLQKCDKVKKDGDNNLINSDKLDNIYVWKNQIKENESTPNYLHVPI